MNWNRAEKQTIGRRRESQDTNRHVNSKPLLPPVYEQDYKPSTFCLASLTRGARLSENTMNNDNDYTPHDAGNNTKQEGDKFYKKFEAAKTADMETDVTSENEPEVW